MSLLFVHDVILCDPTSGGVENRIWKEEGYLKG